jgi:hypothetical protein
MSTQSNNKPRRNPGGIRASSNLSRKSISSWLRQTRPHGAKSGEFRSYGDREGVLTLFGGWTGIDISKYSDDEDFRFIGLPVVHSVVSGWAATVPGGDKLKWNKSRIVDYLMLGVLGAKIVGSPKTVVDELERWVEVADIDGFNMSHIANPDSFEDIIELVIPELQRRALFRKEVEKELEGATVRQGFLGAGNKWLLPDHPGRKFRWVAGEEKSVYESKLTGSES